MPASAFTQQSALLKCLHALGDNIQIQPLSHGDDGVGDHSTGRIASDFANERLVDFECVDRKEATIWTPM